MDDEESPPSLIRAKIFSVMSSRIKIILDPVTELVSVQIPKVTYFFEAHDFGAVYQDHDTGCPKEWRRKGK